MRALPFILAFALGLGAAGLAACGSKTNKAMLPAANAEELKNHLDDVLAAVDSEDCQDAAEAIAQVSTDLLELPSGTSVRLQERLREGVETLEEQAAEECQTQTATTTTETTSTETVPTVTTTPPVTTPTETTTTPPTTTTTTETTPPITTVSPEDTGGAEVP